MAPYRKRIPRRNAPAEAVASGLGWASIGLGFIELAAPRMLARALGLNGKEQLLRACAARELANGVAILATRERAPWVWGRVGGDVLDLAALAMHLRRGNDKRRNVAIALGMVAAIGAVDILCAIALSKQQRRPRRAVRDYSDRSGFRRPPHEMRGIARLTPLVHTTVPPEAGRPGATRTPA